MPKVSKEKKEKCRIETPVFRVGFPHVFKPNSMQGSKPKYSIQMLFSKSSDLTKVKDAIRNAKIAEFGPDKKNWPEDLESPVVNGDDPKYAERDGYKGSWAIKASSNEDQRPTVLSSKKGEDGKYLRITEPAEFYPGCHARAIVFAYVWKFGNKQGVGFILDHVQKVKDDSPFGGRKSPEESFSPITQEDPRRRY